MLTTESPLRILLEKRLSQYISCTNQSRVDDAACYALFNGGKRLRPMIVLTLLEDLTGSFEKGLDAAAALEMIHTYSLIHDDLPPMDNDDFRRGKPTVHKAFDEATAILAGDLLLTKAFEVIAKASMLSNSEKVEVICRLTQASGSKGMILGQALDIGTFPNSIKALEEIHNYKTGALFGASFAIGAFLAGLSDHKVTLLNQVGQELGLAFQIIDDLLDVTAPEKKRSLSDKNNGKKTFVDFLGIDTSKKMAEELLEKSLFILKQEKIPFDKMKGICTSLVFRNR